MFSNRSSFSLTLSKQKAMTLIYRKDPQLWGNHCKREITALTTLVMDMPRDHALNDTMNKMKVVFEDLLTEFLETHMEGEGWNYITYEMCMYLYMSVYIEACNFHICLPVRLRGVADDDLESFFTKCGNKAS